MSKYPMKMITPYSSLKTIFCNIASNFKTLINMILVWIDIVGICHLVYNHLAYYPFQLIAQLDIGV